VRDKDLEAADDLGDGSRAIVLPLLDGRDVVNEDDKVLVLALVVDLGLLGVSTWHFAVVVGW
jgi:hypothetical protein